MRVAWFSPVPPVNTGIAACSAELARVLRHRGHQVDLYPSARAHDFPWRHRQDPYELIVYQFGNSSHHDYEWAYALRYPGLVVLHDTHLHHARAAFLLRKKRADDYREEFRWSHPEVPADAAELAIAGFGSHLYYDWPMVRALVETARLTAVHGTQNLEMWKSGNVEISERVVSIRLGHGELVAPERARAARTRIRAQHGIPDEAVLFGCFGGLTPEKRIPQVLRAFRALVPYAPSARLLLAGAPAAHYDIVADVAAQGLDDGVTLTGYLETDDELTDHLAACDVSLNLRWPTARETSGPWLRALAAGRATIITDLVHLGDVPSLDPRTWTLQRAGSGKREAGNAVCVAIDLGDENHSLRLAMRRLAADDALRAELGRAGQAWWAREHSVELMADDYERVMREAAARPCPAEVPGQGGPRVQLPAHMRDDGDRKLHALLAPFGIEKPI